MTEVSEGAGRGAAEAAGAAVPDPRRWLILATVGIAQLMVVLDSSIPGSNIGRGQGCESASGGG